MNSLSFRVDTSQFHSKSKPHKKSRSIRNVSFIDNGDMEEKRTIKMIKQGMAEMSNNSDRLRRAISKTQEKVLQNTGFELKGNYAMLQDEIIDEENDAENFLNTKQIREEQYRISEKIVRNLANSKKKIWKPQKVELNKQALNILSNRIGQL